MTGVPGGRAGRDRAGCLGSPDRRLAVRAGHVDGADDRVVDRAVAGGGDGTVNAVASRLLDRDATLGERIDRGGDPTLESGPVELVDVGEHGAHALADQRLATTTGLEPFAGAKFRYLAANVIGTDGKTIFPPTIVIEIAIFSRPSAA